MTDSDKKPEKLVTDEVYFALPDEFHPEFSIMQFSTLRNDRQEHQPLISGLDYYMLELSQSASWLEQGYLSGPGNVLFEGMPLLWDPSLQQTSIKGEDETRGPQRFTLWHRSWFPSQRMVAGPEPVP